MRKSSGLFFLFLILFSIFAEIDFFYPILIVFIGVSFINFVLKRFVSPAKGKPAARPDTMINDVAKEIKEKYNTKNPDDTIGTYDPALVEINRFGDLAQATTTRMRLVNPPKKLQCEEITMFLNEGEQVILEPPTTSLATIAVYDRSKHLLGYIPKIKNGVVLSLIAQQRIIRAKVIKLNKSFWNKYIEIEITYKIN